MLLETYIAAVLLALILVGAIVAWADGRYQAARRQQRLDSRQR